MYPQILCMLNIQLISLRHTLLGALHRTPYLLCGMLSCWPTQTAEDMAELSDLAGEVFARRAARELTKRADNVAGGASPPGSLSLAIPLNAIIILLQLSRCNTP